MPIKKKGILFILVIILIGNVFAYTNYNSFLVGTVSIVKDSKVSAEKINNKFSLNNINSYENNLEKTSFKEYRSFNEKKCYQEDPKISNNCGAEDKGNYYYKIEETKGLIYINYSKPEKAIDKSLWQVKWGYDSSTKEPYYLRYPIPLDCWNQKELQFKIYSGDPENYEIGGYCFDGYKWKEIFFEYYEDNAEKTIKASPKIAFDGDYSTGIFQSYHENKQEWLRAVKPENKNSIYEEGMIWIFINSQIEYEKINYENQSSNKDIGQLIYLDNNETKINKISKTNNLFFLIFFFIILISLVVIFFLLKKSYKISKIRKNLGENKFS